MNTAKVKFVRLVNKLSSIRAFAYLISNLALVRPRSTVTLFYVRFWSQPKIYRTELDSSGQALLTSHPPFFVDREEIWNSNKHKHKHKKKESVSFSSAYACTYFTSVHTNIFLCLCLCLCLCLSHKYEPGLKDRPDWMHYHTAFSRFNVAVAKETPDFLPKSISGQLEK